MIKKVIKTIKHIKNVFIPKSEFPIEVTKSPSVNEDTTDYEKWIEEDFAGIPAPVVLSDDVWFGEAPKSEKAMEYVQQKNKELYQRLAEEPKSKEVDNIHQVMYDKATKGINTTLALDPLPQGGSENFQEGWNSGTGMNQFRD